MKKKLTDSEKAVKYCSLKEQTTTMDLGLGGKYFVDFN